MGIDVRDRVPKQQLYTFVTGFLARNRKYYVLVFGAVDLLWRRARRRRYATGDAPRDPELNLASARRALDLPAYPAHDATTDAIATAELFLVLRHLLGARTLREVTS